MDCVLAGAEWRCGRPLNSVVMQHMYRAVRSYFTSLRASGMLGRASKLHKRGKVEEAAAVAREALDLLRAPHVMRNHPAEGAALANLTVLVEEVAHSRGIAGADERDVRDTIEFLKQLPQGSVEELQSWVPYLESRLNGPSAA
jgi:hypothetical protein